MTIAEEIYKLTHERWDFDRAKAIYDTHGDSDMMKFLFNQDWSEFIDQELKDALKELAVLHPIVEHEVKEARQEQLRKASFLPAKLTTPEELNDYPEELQELVKKRKGLFSKSNHARYMLFSKAETDEERKVLAFQIKEDWREIERIWGILNFWKTHKTLSPDIISVNTGDQTVKEMTSRIRNLTTYISKVKSGKKKYKMSIDEMTAELNDLRRRMNGIV